MGLNGTVFASMHEALGSTPGTAKNKQRNNRKELKVENGVLVFRYLESKCTV